MTTLAAFTALINDKAQCAAAGLTTRQMYDLRARVRQREISIEKMEQLLTAAGYKIKQQTEWLTPQDWDKLMLLHNTTK